MGDDVLRRGVFHLTYEIASFVGSFHVKIVVEQPVTSDDARAFAVHAAMNAPLELRVLHARTLLEFLLSDGKKKRQYRADHFLPDWPIKEPYELKALLQRAHDHLAHLSKARVTDEDHLLGIDDKWWPDHMFAPLMRAIVSFTEQLLESEHVAVDAKERPTLHAAVRLLQQKLSEPAREPLSPTGMHVNLVRPRS